jgi:aldose sugar dehydrogenase
MRKIAAFFIALFVVGCQPNSSSTAKTTDANTLPFDISPVATFDEPWAMTFIPETSFALITEKKGKLLVWKAEGPVREISGVPKVAIGGQGGFGDVIVMGISDANNEFPIAISWIEAGESGLGAVVGFATVDPFADAPTLKNLRVIWRQNPKVSGRGHFGHRLAVFPDKKYLFISSGERQKFDPAQDRNSNLGKVVRLNIDGSTPADNPIYDVAKPVQSQIWSLGHRNPLGLAFDAEGRLWDSEMGPAGGDELNLIKPGKNYGWPKASNGSHYDGRDIPDHAATDGFEAPKVFWNPSISPSSLMIYTGTMFPNWIGDAFIGALSGEALIRVDLNGATASKADQWQMNARVREVEQGPDGAIWLLEDGKKGRLLKLTPKK